MVRPVWRSVVEEGALAPVSKPPVIWSCCRASGCISGSAGASRSDELDDRGDAHAAADAERGEAAAQVATLKLVDQRAEDHRPGGAERVAHRDRAAVDVGDLVAD